MFNKPKFKVLTFLLTLTSSLVFLAVFVGTAFVESKQVIELQAEGYNRALAARYLQRLNEYFQLVAEEAHAIGANSEHVEALHAGDQHRFNTSLTHWEETYEHIHYDFVAASLFEGDVCYLSRSYVPELSILPCEELAREGDDLASPGWRLVQVQGEWLAVYSEPLSLKDTGKIIGQLMVGVRLKGNRYLINQLLMPSDGLQMLGIFSGDEPLAKLDRVDEQFPVQQGLRITFSEGGTPLGQDIRIGLVSRDLAQVQLREALIETLVYGCLLALGVSLGLALLLSGAVDRQLQQLITFTRLANLNRNTRWPEIRIREFNLIGEEVVSIVNCLKEREDELEGLNRQLSKNNEEKRQILQHLIQAQERERLRLSNELHDDMAQLLVAVKMNLQLHREELKKIDCPRETLEHAIELVNTIYDTVYNRIRMLRPFELNDFGLGVSLTSLPAVKILEQLDYAVEFDINQSRPLQKELMSSLYRIAQEALSNVIKHAGGTYVLVKLEDESDGLRMVIEDDGEGFGDNAATRTGGFGLLGIRERAEHMHAELTIHSDEGVKVELFVPARYAYVDDKAGEVLAST
ncbi:sensor histidine kinase [Marinobacterium sediminicola]|uniref:Histidine kinase-, DNA gyrase B-, and HSP90-like ATPase n=1 Tax=Marinobacterium sediminicola TaxID=518898 RepID=A0ABY1RVV3_9GAMM|nr:ATP-binding protein [Marinobacterium sediminicola]ULG70528.1 histidine kinase [Marinobacterium sediminicola]SMR69094.1 Histidine kinase-, DNA gyrase B-, and HSP90-like ATPase [Marinobacterium sediminicola]